MKKKSGGGTQEYAGTKMHQEDWMEVMLGLRSREDLRFRV